MKRIGLLFLSIMISVCAIAQNDSPQRREFNPEEYWKILQDFVTREAQLTDAEAEGFYPLLREMRNEQRKNNKKAMDIIRSVNEGTTDAEYGTKVKQLLEIDVQNKQIEENYYKKFHEVMSWEKVFKVRHALYKFDREALNRFRPPHRGQRDNHDNQEK